MIFDMTKSLVADMASSMERGVTAPAGPYDPYTWITGTPTKGDDFTSTTLNIGIHGRTLPIGTTPGTWSADGTLNGTGSGGLKITTTTGNKNFRNAVTSHTDAKVRMIWNPGTGANNISIYLRSTTTTGYPQDGYFAQAVLSTGVLNINRLAAGSPTVLATRTVATSAMLGENSIEIRTVGTTISGYFNGVLIGTATDATYASGSRWGCVVHAGGTGTDLVIDYIDFTTI